MKKLLSPIIFLLILLTVAFTSCKKATSSEEAPPDITGIQPESGPVGTAVTINGSNFSTSPASNSVSFNGTAAEIQSATTSQIKTTVPDGASTGSVSVSVAGMTAQGPAFTVEEQSPGIKAINPESGAVGTEVVITGMNFSVTATENNITFNGTNAVVKQASETELVTEVPDGATDGPVKVIVDGKTATGPTDFDVITEGTLEFIVQTTGEDKDQDGYMVTLTNAGTGKSTASEDTVYFEDLSPDTYTVELTNMADNCDVSGSNPRDGDVAAGDTTKVAMEVICTSTGGTENDLSKKIVFVETHSGTGNQALYVINPDGTDKRLIRRDRDNNLLLPDISPDGTQLIYQMNQNSPSVWKVNANNSGNTKLADNASTPAWSPDGKKTAFVRSANLVLMDADGSNEVEITDKTNTDGVESPAWFPDGSKILFRCDQGFGAAATQLCTVKVDGSDFQQLTNDSYAYREPSISPDGSKIAFHAYLDDNTGYKPRKIYVMDADGSNMTLLVDEESYHPTWSPTGSYIAFHGKYDSDGDTYLSYIMPDGSNRKWVPGVQLYKMTAGGAPMPGGNGGPDWGTPK
ncbi:IPT/TIG domain-containing protein [Fodinibius halophilus]|uniref:IPT/TIG domain-containing protein n=1 Tax=Fodinibius halophilus TaxID=1736908 RepID=A0A6M1T7S3_9BACT|nr:IPT/TIG domain-containing protein [Fodinibius halophilus]NGP88031.1 hypothetical protein [Fodinibius halophilus]